MHELDINAESLSGVYLDYLDRETYLGQGAEELCARLTDYWLAIINNEFTAVLTARIETSPLYNTFG